MYKIYAYIKFQLIAPLAIGGVAESRTDKDVLKNAKGEPFIPATALAGVYRSFFNEAEIEKYFGFVKKPGDGGKVDKHEEEKEEKQGVDIKESSIIVYDGRLCEDNASYHVGIRNGVGLDQYKTAVDGAKFDYEVVEPGSIFWTALEYTIEDPTSGAPDTYVIDRILSAWTDGAVVIGGKSTRGLGRLKALEKKTISFHLPEQAARWIEFDLYNNAVMTAAEPTESGWTVWDESKLLSTKERQCHILLTLKQEGPVTVRTYSTEVAKKKEGENVPSAPDYKQLAYTEKNSQGEREVAVIPGTSWAGVFRHSMAQYLGMDWKSACKELEKLFGTIGNGRAEKITEPAMKSKILFSETYLRNGKFKLVSRNAIDRFSGGTADTALFTEKMYYGGEGGMLEITIPISIESKFMKALAASIADLHEGFMAVGGSVAIGHGLFSAMQIEMDGKTLKDNISGETIYRFVLENGHTMDRVEGGAVNV